MLYIGSLDLFCPFKFLLEIAEFLNLGDLIIY
jgi:hypothetical protein